MITKKAKDIVEEYSEYIKAFNVFYDLIELLNRKPFPWSTINIRITNVYKEKINIAKVVGIITINSTKNENKIYFKMGLNNPSVLTVEYSSFCLEKENFPIESQIILKMMILNQLDSELTDEDENENTE